MAPAAPEAGTFETQPAPAEEPSLDADPSDIESALDVSDSSLPRFNFNVPSNAARQYFESRAEVR